MVAAPSLKADRPSAVPCRREAAPRLDGRTFEALVRDHTDRWHAVARRMLGSDHDAADAVQEAYVAALGALDRFRGEAQPSTWLHRIVVNACLMRLRTRRGAAVSVVEERLTAPAEGDRLLAEEARQEVRACIARLPAGYREVLVLRDLDERDTDETARLLRLAPGAVKTRLHRARRALRALLEETVGDAYAPLGA
jgi:RNA polymerase sigma-70 factor (ECF subfamily)